jgi:NAD(P)H-hydrate epimerase
VFDADAVFARSREPSAALAAHAGPRILTPHEGEMRRLLHRDDRPPRGDLERLAREFATKTGSIVVLKGPRTLIASGDTFAHNTTGNPGMATAGAGDVLTGIVAAVIAQKLAAFDAARLAAWVHGRAGDLAAGAIGQVSLVATDILHSLSAAFRKTWTAADVD